MTTQPDQPQQQPQAPDGLEELLVVQAATLLTLEAASAATATYALQRALEDFARTANGRWLMAGAHPVTAQLLDPARRGQVVAQLTAYLDTVIDQTSRDLPPVLRTAAERALRLGAEHAGQQVGLQIPADALELDRLAESLIDATPKAAIDRLERAQGMLERAETGRDLQNVIAQARLSVAQVQTGSTYLTNHVANDAARQVSVRLGEKLLWIAERDACVVCLALAGHVADPNEGVGFDEEATFGPYPAPTVWPYGMPLMRPPRHPHCRCQVCVWLGSAPGSPSLPDRLRHEARRSILKGWSLPSETNTVRLKAAQKLLASGGGGLPRSVQEEAAVAVARGKFKSRSVPRYTPPKEHHRV